MSKDESLFLKCLRKEPVSRGQLREQLGWEEQRFEVAVSLLLEKGIIKRAAGGRGTLLERNPEYTERRIKKWIIFAVVAGVSLLVVILVRLAQDGYVSAWIQSNQWVISIVATLLINSASEDYYLKELARSSLRAAYLKKRENIHGGDIAPVLLGMVFAKQPFIRERGEELPRILTKGFIKTKFWIAVSIPILAIFSLLFIFGGMAFSSQKVPSFFYYFSFVCGLVIFTFSKLNKFFSSQLECYLYDKEQGEWFFITAKQNDRGLYNQQPDAQPLQKYVPYLFRFFGGLIK